MPVELFPRLYRPVAESVWSGNLAELDLNALSEQADRLEHPEATEGATGGVPVSRGRLREIRDAVLALSAEYGFPEPVRQLKGRFDAHCSRYLVEQSGIPAAEAMRDEVWSYLTVVVLPDVAVWRFEGRAAERMLGGIRNTFQRLWLRGRLIAAGGDSHESDWSLLGCLTEDAFVAILERPRLSANPVLAREFAEGWRRCSEAIGGGNMECIHRKAALNLLAARAVVSLDALDSGALSALVDDYFRLAAENCGSSILN